MDKSYLFFRQSFHLRFMTKRSCYQGCRGPIGTAAADVGQDDSRDATPSLTEASTGGQARLTGAANMIELAVVGCGSFFS